MGCFISLSHNEEASGQGCGENAVNMQGQQEMYLCCCKPLGSWGCVLLQHNFTSSFQGTLSFNTVYIVQKWLTISSSPRCDLVWSVKSFLPTPSHLIPTKIPARPLALSQGLLLELVEKRFFSWESPAVCLSAQNRLLPHLARHSLTKNDSNTEESREQKRSEIWTPGLAMTNGVPVNRPLSVTKILLLKLATQNSSSEPKHQTKIDSHPLFDSVQVEGNLKIKLLPLACGLDRN